MKNNKNNKNEHNHTETKEEKILRLFDLIPKNCLQLTYDKEQLDPDNKLKLSDEEWEQFVEESSDRFFEYCEEEGKELLEEWSIQHSNE